MSHARSSGLLQRVRTLFGSGVAAGLSDAELLERFRAKRDTAEDAALAAEVAFAALVARHGPMVLGVCRRALADPNDVDDAFQATFLVLVRRARSVRVGDSLGRWLYGVARRVAAKARARSQRDRVQAAPLANDPVAPDDPADQIGLLAALDEEVSRLPEKYRAPVVLCHLEGLTHAEAADRLRWPVGTVSGRLSRARDLLRNRLVRRGIAPGVALLTSSEGVRAAVSEPLAAATVQAATQLAMGGGSPGGAFSASSLSLMNAVLRAAAVVRLKVAAAVLLAIALAGAAVGAGIAVGTSAPGPARNQDVGRAATVALQPAPNPTADHRPADEIVTELKSVLALADEPDLGYAGGGELRLMPNVNDLKALPTAGKRLFIVADVNHALHLRMFDLEGIMVLDSDAKRFTSTWVDYIKQLAARMWPPHEVTEIEKMSVMNAVRELAHRSVPDEMRRLHGRIAALVGELRTAYPHDPRVARYLPERWGSLCTFGPRSVVDREVREILETAKDPELRTSALYFATALRFREPIDGRVAVSLARSFAAHSPGDKRAGELLFMAASILFVEWFLLVRLAAVFAMVAGLVAATIGMRRWLKYVVRVGAVLLVAVAVALAGFFFLANDTLIALIQSWSEKFSGGLAVVMLVPRWFEHEMFQLRVIAGSIRAAVAVTLAVLCAVSLVIARRRLADPPTRWLSAIRLGIIVFFAVLAASCGVDACLIGFQRRALRERIHRDYPGSFRGKLIQREARQHERIGERFRIQAAAPGKEGSAERLRHDFLSVPKALGYSDVRTNQAGVTQWLNSESINPRC